MQAVEATIAEYEDEISGADFVAQNGEEFVEVGRVPGRDSFCEESGDCDGRIETLLRRDQFGSEHRSDQHVPCLTERGGDLVLEDVAPGRIGTGLEDRPQASVGVFMPYCLDRFAYGGRMMGEIVHYNNSTFFSPNLLAALDTLKGAGHGNCLECHKEKAGSDPALKEKKIDLSDARRWVMLLYVIISFYFENHSLQPCCA